MPITIYVLKIKRGGWDGWGRDLPVSAETLGSYREREKAEDAKAAYEMLDDKDLKMFDVGYPWIESQVVQ